MSFGAPMRAATPMPPAPTQNDPETRRKLEEAAALQRKAKGRASTILTGGAGLSAEATTAKSVLLGD